MQSETKSMKNSNSKYQSNSNFQANYTYQYPIEKKNIEQLSINSEQSLPSSHEQIKQIEKSVIEDSIQYNYDEMIHPNQRLESQDISIQVPINPQQEIQPIQNKSIPSQSYIFQPFQIQQQSISQNERSFDGISSIRNTISIKKQNRSKTHSFYYDRMGNSISQIMPPLIENITKYIFIETIIPLIITFIIYIINFFVQKQINQFCYASQYCFCDNFGTKIWSWIRQLIMWKFGLLVYRKLILCRLAMGSNNLSHKEPITEYILMYIITLFFDFILVIWIENNQDYVFVILVYIIGVVVLLNTFRVRDWIIVIRKGSGMFLYDFSLVLLIVFIYYSLPNIIVSLQDKQGKISGLQSFLYLYPIIDWAMEIYMDLIYQRSQFGELYIYQLQLIILGIRIGILNLMEIWTFEFWYNILMLGIMRVNNSSMFLTVFLRRWIFYLIPDLQFITKMNETKKSLKGKHGSYLEHQFWIIFYYFFYLTESIVPYIAKNTYLITNCQFNSTAWNYTKEYYQPAVIWILFLVTEIIGILLNKQKKYDNIKYFGGCQFNFIENIMIRLSGYYFFQIAVMIPFLFKQLNDLTQVNQHLTTVNTQQY